MQYRMRSESTGPDGRPGTANGGRRLAAIPKAQYGVNLKQLKSGSHLRSGSSLGARSGSSLDRRLDDEGGSPTDSGVVISRMSKNEEPDCASLHELNALKEQLAEKDKAFNEQAAALLEMETSITELQSLMQNAPNSPTSMTSPVRSNSFEDTDVAQLRALLREKSERIQLLTSEFDAHRTDFRSTIDTLELASSETERVYEKRVDDLLAEIRELHERNDDVESVARQLKQLEELVAELEEGLEDARRGEAEARAEVEFLRGEVERCREELRREREKSAAAVANAAAGTLMRNGSDEVEKKDDEIRGLKAIIHSLSRDSVALDDASLSGIGLERNLPSQPTGGKRYPLDGPAELVKERQNSEKLQQDIMELQSQMQSKALREQELSREIEDLRKKKEARSSSSSEKTITPWANGRASGDPPETGDHGLRLVALALINLQGLQISTQASTTVRRHQLKWHLRWHPEREMKIKKAISPQ
jgi:DNA repair exonuclease SbcCD ATPase subunit